MIKIIKKIFLILGLSISFEKIQSQMMPIGNNQPLFAQMPTAEEMQQIEEFLKTLSPEEMEQLAQLGEQIIKEAEAEGRPLFPTDMQFPPALEMPQQKTPEPLPSPAQTPEDKIKNDTKKKTEQILVNTIISLIDLINTLRDKSNIDEIYSRIFHHLDAKLDIFIYYLHVMKDNARIKNITEEEFALLKKELIELEHSLREPVETLEIPSIVSTNNFKKQQREKRRRAIRKAEQTLDNCKNILERAFTEKEILKECEKLLKKYEPEALKIKDDQEKRSQIAGSQASKLAVTNTNKIVQAPTYNTKTAHYAAPARASSTGITIPSSYEQDKYFGSYNETFNKSSKKAASPAAQNTPKKPGDVSKDGEKTSSNSEKKSPDEIEKNRTKIKENQEKMVLYLKNANQLVYDKRALLNSFVDQYMTSQEKNPEFEKLIYETLEDINLALENAQKYYHKCISDAKTIPGGKDLRNVKEESKKNITIHTHNLDEFNDKIQSLKEKDHVSEEKDSTFNEPLVEIEKNLLKLPIYKDKIELRKKSSKTLESTTPESKEKKKIQSSEFTPPPAPELISEKVNNEEIEQNSLEQNEIKEDETISKHMEKLILPKLKLIRKSKS